MMNFSALQVLAVLDTDPDDETRLMVIGYEVWNGSQFVASCLGIQAANGILLGIFDQAIAALLEEALLGKVLTVDRATARIDLYSGTPRVEASFDSPYTLELWAVEVAITEHNHEPDKGSVFGYPTYRQGERELEFIRQTAHQDLHKSFETFLFEFQNNDEPFLTPEDPSAKIVRGQTTSKAYG